MDLLDSEWETPFFKLMANNDTAGAPGHQAGIVIPKAIREFLPPFTSQTSAEQPTQSIILEASLYVEGTFVCDVSTRYQEQTWGGTRSPETRLTENLQALRGPAQSDDLLIFQRSLVQLNKIRIFLVPMGSDQYRTHLADVGNSRWGPLSKILPVSNSELAAAKELIDKRLYDDFSIFDPNADRIETRGYVVARNQAFRSRVMETYDYKCALTGYGVNNLKGRFDLEAAHIVPRSLMGPDDVRNGLALTRSMHWAFDQGLWSVQGRNVYISNKVLDEAENAPLIPFRGVPLRDTLAIGHQASPDAIQWHFENIAIRD